MTGPFILIAHSPANQTAKDRLVRHLETLRHTGPLTLWSRDEIEPGSESRPKLLQAADQADLALLLLSVDLLNDREVIHRLLPRLRERQATGKLTVIPVLISACMLLHALEAYEAALPLAERALHVFQSTLPPDHPYVKYALGWCESIKRALEEQNE